MMQFPNFKNPRKKKKQSTDLPFVYSQSQSPSEIMWSDVKKAMVPFPLKEKKSRFYFKNLWRRFVLCFIE
jgi:hypothetical protein